MILDCVVSAVNLNPIYLDFIPIFIKTWNKLYPHVDVKIIMLAEDLPERFRPYKKHIILFPLCLNVPDEAIPVITTYIRFLIPALMKYNNGIMITDIDILPMNSNYYTENIKDIQNNYFINLRNWTDGLQYAACYYVGTAKTWGEIMEIKSVKDIYTRLYEVWHTHIHTIPQHLKKNPRYDFAFYFRCNLNVASYRRWKDLKKKIPLKFVKKSLSKRSTMDKKRTYSPLKKMKDAYLIRSDKL